MVGCEQLGDEFIGQTLDSARAQRRPEMGTAVGVGMGNIVHIAPEQQAPAEALDA